MMTRLQVFFHSLFDIWVPGPQLCIHRRMRACCAFVFLYRDATGLGRDAISSKKPCTMYGSVCIDRGAASAGENANTVRAADISAEHGVPNFILHASLEATSVLHLSAVEHRQQP
jgi:hypothetical protein